MGQPLAHNLILKSISAHVNTENPGKALVLSLHGSTGTGNLSQIFFWIIFSYLGKNFVAKHIVESLYKRGYASRYARLYVSSRDFMHNDEQHLREYKVYEKSVFHSSRKIITPIVFLYRIVLNMILNVQQVLVNKQHLYLMKLIKCQFNY